MVLLSQKLSILTMFVSFKLSVALNEGLNATDNIENPIQNRPSNLSKVTFSEIVVAIIYRSTSTQFVLGNYFIS